MKRVARCRLIPHRSFSGFGERGFVNTPSTGEILAAAKFTDLAGSHSPSWRVGFAAVTLSALGG